MEKTNHEEQSDALDRLYSLAREALQALKKGDVGQTIKFLDDAAYAAEKNGEKNEAQVFRNQMELLTETEDVEKNREEVRKLLDLIFI